MTKTEELLKRLQRAQAGGGTEKAKAQKEKGKLLARERLDLLLDEGSFRELDALVETKGREFGLEGKGVPGDGVVTGTGTIHGRTVCVFSQDFTVMGGSLGLAHAEKICKVLDLAVRIRAPMIGLCDSGGARIQEGVESLGGYAEIFYRNVQASGFIPQISAILGPCAGGAVYSPAITDFVFMVENTSFMFITGPEVIKAATGEQTDFESLGGAHVHATKSGVAHFTAGSEQDCFRQIQELLGYLPQNGEEKPLRIASSDNPSRTSPELEKICEMDSKKPYRVHDVIWEIADAHQFLEVHKGFAENIVVGFIRLNGESVGVVANNPKHLSGALDISASEKAARFVRFCDAFNIPLLTLVDVPGYWPGVTQEHGGIIRHGAKLLYAYSQATVPKVTVILRKAYGGAYDVMSSKHIRGDFNFAWPGAEIAVMGPQGAVEILYSKEIKTSKDPEKFKQDKVQEYTRKFANPYYAAQRGFLDEVIGAAQTRPRLIQAFECLRTKRVEPLKKRHGNIPL
ncbi:MAG: acyl-CoA carboxylase subunit beta [Elusimicrobia bacterium]|nr:acyl-CoA carboxylase subunit beta [Elusimicrobiota bacterium]